MSENKIIKTDAPAPPGFSGEGFFATKLDSLIGMARSYSLLATSFCDLLLRNRIYGDDDAYL